MAQHTEYKCDKAVLLTRRLVIYFGGCGGDRKKSERPQICGVSETLSKDPVIGVLEFRKSRFYVYMCIFSDASAITKQTSMQEI